MKYRFVLILSAAIFCAAALPFSRLEAAPDVQQATDLKADQQTQTPSIDFETYQRNVDDIFRVYLMANPDVNYGINDIIVELNRKIAANPGSADSVMTLAHLYRILGQPSEANRFYEKALKLDPNNANLNIFSAITSLQSKKMDQALTSLDLAIKKNPADTYARMARGKTYMMLREYKKAAEDFQKILQIQPGSRQAAFALSLAYEALGQRTKAFEILEKLKNKNPKDPFVRYHLGALLFENKKYPEAVKDWEGLFKDGVRDIHFLLNLAVAYLKSGQDAKAKIILDHMSFFFPQEIDIDFLMAETYRQMALYDESARRYRLVLAEDPYYISAFIGLADTLERQGKTQESRKVMAQAEDAAREVTLMEAEKKEQERIKQTSQNILHQFAGNGSSNSPPR